MASEKNRIQQTRDNDLLKGAFEEDDNPRQNPQARFKGQLSHRESDPLIKSSDSDFPEPGGSPEHSGEPEEKPWHPPAVAKAARQASGSAPSPHPAPPWADARPPQAV
jgi:hypothetical protein